jgi:hypothetical protein
MDVLRSARAVALLTALCGIGGCANLETIQRSTTVPWDKTHADGAGKGLAVHLDAQQRLVVFAAEQYCAEPSPDALAAYAAAIGLSASALPSKSGALSAAMNSAAGSIGLRTQSITLMRDTLYRICEGGLNKTLSEEQVAVLLARSQDLTAVVLAVEQLTGAVASPTVTLSTGGGSSALASLTANTQALNAANAARDGAKTQSEKAEDARKTAETAKNEAFAELNKRREALKNNEGGTTQAMVDEQQRVFDDKSSKYDAAAALAVQKADAYERTNETAEQIALARDAANNMTTASVSSAGTIGGTRPPVSDKTISEVSKDVRGMVETLLNKPYLEQICLAVVTSPGATKAVTALSAASTAASNSAFLTQDSEIRASILRTTRIAQDAQTSRAELVGTCLKYFTAMAQEAARKASPTDHSSATDEKAEAEAAAK